MDDVLLVDRLRGGDEAAFTELVDRVQTPMVNLAMSFVSSRAIAEDVVGDAWVAVLKGLGRFEGRSSLKTWIFSIVANRARTTGAREQRTRPVDLSDGATVDAHRFDRGGAWTEPPVPFTDAIEVRFSSPAVLDAVRAALRGLPESQRAVVTLPDVDGLTSREVCDVLNISEANQRVLLHRGRSRVRAALELEAVAR